MRLQTLKLPLFALLSVSACRSTAPKESSKQCIPAQQQPYQQNQGFGVVNGRETQAWPEVVLLVRLTSNSIEMCSGTFVGHNVLVTAAHCIDNSATGGLTVLRNMSRLDLEQEGRSGGSASNSVGIKPLRSIHHDGLSQETLVGPNGEFLQPTKTGQDVAFLILPDNSAPATKTFYQGSVAAKTAAQIVGFGFDSLQSTSRYAIKREGNLALTRSTRYPGVFDSKTGSGIWSTPDAASAPGDSGGPVFIGGQIVGITSSGYDRAAVLGGAVSSFADLTSQLNLELKQKAQAAGAVFGPSSTGSQVPGTTNNGNTQNVNATYNNNCI